MYVLSERIMSKVDTWVTMMDLFGLSEDLVLEFLLDLTSNPWGPESLCSFYGKMWAPMFGV